MDDKENTKPDKEKQCQVVSFRDHLKKKIQKDRKKIFDIILKQAEKLKW